MIQQSPLLFSFDPKPVQNQPIASRFVQSCRQSLPTDVFLLAGSAVILVAREGSSPNLERGSLYRLDQL